MITTTINSDRWFQKVQAKARQLNLTTGEVLTDEARMFTGTLINLTPPTRGSGPGGTVAEPRLRAQTVGEAAVQRDILRAHTPVDLEWPDAPLIFRQPRVREVILQGNYGAFVAILKNMGNWANWRVGMFDRGQHNRSKRSRGRVLRSQRVFVFGESQIPDYWNYMQKIVERVGRLKAGWLPAFYALGGKRVAAFVSRHRRGARGRVQITGITTSNPRIEVANSAMGVGQLERLVNGTFRARTQAIKRRMRLLASNFAKGDVEAVKAARAAHGDIDQQSFTAMAA